MKIFKTEDVNSYNYITDEYYFVDELGYLNFHQMGSFDLAFTVHKFDIQPNTLSFSIDKDKYPKIHELISSMLDEIENLKYLRGTNRITEEYMMLYEKGYFSWQSDAPANENSVKEDFVYNYFNIHKNNNSYIFEFVSNVDSPFFTVEVNTDRSRYMELRFPVWDFFHKLRETCELKSEDEKRKILKHYHNQSTRQK